MATSAAKVEAVLLGNAQDGGVPQAGCACPRCLRARKDPAARKWVVSLGVVDHAGKKYWLIDATPDFREQLHWMIEACPGYSLAGIALTHAHTGHYTGLIHLGKEAWNVRGMPVYASARMAAFLRDNAPWAQLVRQGNLRLVELYPDRPRALSAGVRVTPVSVPHRGEWSDTLAFVIEGRQRALFYCPDIDSWETWEGLAGFVGRFDVALLDATFYSPDELPGRDMRAIPHPLATETVRRLQDAPVEVVLIHLNHSNPLHDPGPEREWVVRHGARVGELGQRWGLG